MAVMTPTIMPPDVKKQKTQVSATQSEGTTANGERKLEKRPGTSTTKRLLLFPINRCVGCTRTVACPFRVEPSSLEGQFLDRAPDFPHRPLPSSPRSH